MEKKNKFPKPLLIVLIVLGIIFVISIILCVTGGLLWGNVVKNETVESTSEKEPSQPVDNVDSNTDSENNKDYELTENVFKNKDFSLNIGAIETNYTEEYMDLKEGFRVVRIPITFENLSDTDMFTDSFKAKVDNKMVEEYYGADDTLIMEELLSGTSKDGAIYYEIQNDSTELILVYDYGFWTDKKVEFKLDVTLK